MYAEIFSAKPLLMILRSKIINFRYLLYIYIIIYIIILTKHIIVIAGASVHARTYAYARKFATY